MLALLSIAATASADVAQFRGGGTSAGPGPAALHGVKWRFHTGGPVVASPTIASARIYIGSYDGNLYALDAATGAVAWKVDTGARIASSAAVANGIVYVLGYDASVHAFAADTGKA